MMCYILMIGILNMVEKCLSLTPSQKTYLNTLLIGMMENGSIKFYSLSVKKERIHINAILSSIFFIIYLLFLFLFITILNTNIEIPIMPTTIAEIILSPVLGAFPGGFVITVAVSSGSSSTSVSFWNCWFL